MSRQNTVSDIDPNVITLFANEKYTGTQKTYSVGTFSPDFSADGFTAGLSSIQIPAKTKVILYPGVGYTWNHSHGQYNTSSYLALNNGWESPWQVNLNTTIGQMGSQVSGEWNSGYDFNDMLVSMQSWGNYENGGYQYLEVQQRGVMGVGGEVGATIFDYLNGVDYIAYYATSDSKFGPVHNDAASSIAVAFYYVADLFAAEDYGSKIGTFTGSTDTDWFPLRIYNLSSKHMNTASSIKISGGDFGVLRGAGS
ncbi:hypothetical protein E2A72_03955 [Salmonella enterica]|nr:hypothetical protein [Salmonella enterica]EJK4621605.1 hypothetical protein [Salmonella enterica]